jgi:hypothetical protein
VKKLMIAGIMVAGAGIAVDAGLAVGYRSALFAVPACAFACAVMLGLVYLRSAWSRP